jgi:hypothetical protein
MHNVVGGGLEGQFLYIHIIDLDELLIDEEGYVPPADLDVEDEAVVDLES